MPFRPSSIIDAEKDLKEASQGLDPKALTFVKTMHVPPPGVVELFEAIAYLFGNKVTKSPKGWKRIKAKLLKNSSTFMKNLKALKSVIDDGELSAAVVSKVKELTEREEFTPEGMASKCSYVVDIAKYLLSLMAYYDAANRSIVPPPADGSPQESAATAAPLAVAATTLETAAPEVAKLPPPPTDRVYEIGKFYNNSFAWPPLSTNIAALPPSPPASAAVLAAGIPLDKGGSSVADCLSNWL